MCFSWLVFVKLLTVIGGKRRRRKREKEKEKGRGKKEGRKLVFYNTKGNYDICW